MNVKYLDINPEVHSSAYVSENATLVGEVFVGENASIWFGSVLRADQNKIIVGKGTNIQDNTTIHVSTIYPVVLGENVTIGHACLIHACEVKDNALIGMGSTVMDGSVIGKNCIVGAGSLITKGKIFEDNSLIYGRPAKFIRKINDEERKELARINKLYINKGRQFKEAQNLKDER